MDVEEVAETDPEALVKRHVPPGERLPMDLAKEIATEAELADDVLDQVAEMLVTLVDVAVAEDATLIEVNPLIVTTDREVWALDAKVTIDGNALFRHPELAELAEDEGATRRSRWPRRRASPT